MPTEKARFVLHFCDTLFQIESSKLPDSFSYDGFKKGDKEDTFLAPFLSISQLEQGWLCRKPSSRWLSKHTLLTYFQSEKDTLIHAFSLLETQNNTDTLHVPLTAECISQFTLFIKDATLSHCITLHASLLSFLTALLAAEKTAPAAEWKTCTTATFQLLDTLLQLAIRLGLDAQIAVASLTELTTLASNVPVIPEIINHDQIQYLIATYTFSAWVLKPLTSNSAQLHWAGQSLAQQLIAFCDGFYNRNSVEKEFKKQLNQFLKYKENITRITSEDAYLLHAFIDGFFSYLETQPDSYQSIGASFFHHLTDIAPTSVLFDLFIALGKRLYFHSCILLTLSSQENTENSIPTLIVQKWLNLADFPFKAITYALPEHQRHRSFVFPMLRYANIDAGESLLFYLTPIAPPDAQELRLFLMYYFNLSDKQMALSFKYITQVVIEEQLIIINDNITRLDDTIQTKINALLSICPAYVLTAYLTHKFTSYNQKLIDHISEIDSQRSSRPLCFFTLITPEKLTELIQPDQPLTQLHLALFIDCVTQANPANALAISNFITQHPSPLLIVCQQFPSLSKLLLTKLNRLYKNCKTDSEIDQVSFLNTYFSFSDQLAEYGITLNTYAAHEELLTALHAHKDLTQILHHTPSPTHHLLLAWREHPEFTLDFILTFTQLLTEDTQNVSRETPLNSPFFKTLLPQINSKSTAASLKEMLLALLSISSYKTQNPATNTLTHYFYEQATPIQQYSMIRLFLYHPAFTEIVTPQINTSLTRHNRLQHPDELRSLFIKDPESEARHMCLKHLATLTADRQTTLPETPPSTEPISRLSLSPTTATDTEPPYPEIPFSALMDWHRASPALVNHIKTSALDPHHGAHIVLLLSKDFPHLLEEFIQFSLDSDLPLVPIFDALSSESLYALSNATSQADSDRLYTYCILRKIDPCITPNLLFFFLFNAIPVDKLDRTKTDILSSLLMTACDSLDIEFTQTLHVIFPLFSKRFFIRQLELNTIHSTHILSLFNWDDLLILIKNSEILDTLFILICTHHSHLFQTLESETLTNFLTELPIKSIISIAKQLPQTTNIMPLNAIFSRYILNTETPLEWSQLYLFLAYFTGDFSTISTTYLNQIFDHFFKQRQIKNLSKTDQLILHRYLKSPLSREKLHDVDPHCFTPIRDWLFKQNTLTLKQFSLDYCKQWLDEDAQVAFLTIIDSIALGTRTIADGRDHLLTIINKEYVLLNADDLILSHLLTALADNAILFSNDTYTWQSVTEKSVFHESIFLQGLLKDMNATSVFLESLIEQTPLLGTELSTRIFPPLGAREIWDIFWNASNAQQTQLTSDAIFSIIRASMMDNLSFKYLCANITTLSYAKHLVNDTKWRSLLSLFNAALSAQNDLHLELNFFTALFNPLLFSHADVCRILLGLFGTSAHSINAVFLEFITDNTDNTFTQYWPFLLSHRKEIPLFSETGFIYNYLCQLIIDGNDEHILMVAHYLSQSHHTVRPLFISALLQLLPQKERPHTWREQVTYDAQLRQISAHFSRIFAYQLKHHSEEGLATLFQFSRHHFEKFPLLLRAIVSTLAQWMTFYPNDVSHMDGMPITIDNKALYNLLTEYSVLNDAGLLTLTDINYITELPLSEAFPLISSTEAQQITTVLTTHFSVHQSVLNTVLSLCCDTLDHEDYLHELTTSTPEGFSWVSCFSSLLHILRKNNPVLLGKILDLKTIPELLTWVFSPALSFDSRQTLFEIYSYYLPSPKLTLLIRHAAEHIQTTSTDFVPHYADVLLILSLHQTVLMAQQFNQYPELKHHYPFFTHTKISTTSLSNGYRKYNLLELWLFQANQKNSPITSQQLTNYLTVLTPTIHPVLQQNYTLCNQAKCNGLLQANYCDQAPHNFLSFTNLILLQMRHNQDSPAQIIQHTTAFNTFHSALLDQNTDNLSRYHFAYIIHGLCSEHGNFSTDLAKKTLSHYPMPYTPALLDDLNFNEKAISSINQYLTTNNYLMNGRLSNRILEIEKSIEIPHLTAPQSKIFRDHIIHLFIHHQRQLLRIFQIQHDLYALFNTTDDGWRQCFIELFLSMTMDKWNVIIQCLTHHEPYMKNQLFSDSLRHMITFELGEHISEIHIDSLQTIAQKLFSEHEKKQRKTISNIENTIHKIQKGLKL